MFEIIIIAFVLLILILLVVFYPKSSKKNKIENNSQKIALNLLRVKHDLGVKASFETHLVHQTLVLDESGRKLLVVNNKNFTSEVHPLDAIRSLKVINTTSGMLPGRQNNKESGITKTISLEMLFENHDRPVIVMVFDQSVHAPAQLEAMEKHAWYLHEKITKAKIHELLSA
jgi:hypothetical protein